MQRLTNDPGANARRSDHATLYPQSPLWRPDHRLYARNRGDDSKGQKSYTIRRYSAPTMPADRGRRRGCRRSARMAEGDLTARSLPTTRSSNASAVVVPPLGLHPDRYHCATNASAAEAEAFTGRSVHTAWLSRAAPKRSICWPPWVRDGMRSPLHQSLIVDREIAGVRGALLPRHVARQRPVSSLYGTAARRMRPSEEVRRSLDSGNSGRGSVDEGITEARTRDREAPFRSAR